MYWSIGFIIGILNFVIWILLLFNKQYAKAASESLEDTAYGEAVDVIRKVYEQDIDEYDDAYELFVMTIVGFILHGLIGLIICAVTFFAWPLMLFALLGGLYTFKKVFNKNRKNI